MKDFKQLNVWVKAHRLTREVYHATTSFPKDELYGLTSQLRRAAASIPTNIAEGCGRSSDAELARFLIISMGSASEVEYLILLTKDLDMLCQTDYANLTSGVIEIKRMLATFIKKLRADR